MRDQKLSIPQDVKTGAELAESLAAIVERDDAESARIAVRDRLRRTEPWVQKAYQHRKILADGIAALAKLGALQGLVRLLDRADLEALRRFQRQNPDLVARTTRTVDQLRVFCVENGTPSARRALSRALRSAEAVAGEDAAAMVDQHLQADDERAAASLLERVIDQFYGQPDSDEVRQLRRELDAFLKGVIDAKQVPALTRALARHASETGRRLGKLKRYGLQAQLTDLMKRYANASLCSKWTKALGHQSKDDAKTVKAIAQAVKKGDGQAAIETLIDVVLAPLDDRFGGGGDKGSAKLLNNVLAAVQKHASIDQLVRFAYEHDLAFQQANPHVLFVGALHRLQSAIYRVGDDKVKAPFEDAWNAFATELAPPAPPEEAGESEAAASEAAASEAGESEAGKEEAASGAAAPAEATAE